MLAVSKGFVDIVYGLDQCPLLDINHQDNDGNTALMIAAQAGRIFNNTLNRKNMRHDPDNEKRSQNWLTFW